MDDLGVPPILGNLHFARENHFSRFHLMFHCQTFPDGKLSEKTLTTEDPVSDSLPELMERVFDRQQTGVLD